MFIKLTHICFLLMLLVQGGSLFAQAEKRLIAADNQYRLGNFEKSLALLNELTFINNEQFIQKKILVIENCIALHLSEDSIRKEMISIYKLNPNFDRKSLNMDISEALAQRLNTIIVYPKLIGSLEGSLLYTIPLIRKKPYVCEECVSDDRYPFSSLNSGIGFRVTYLLNTSTGAEVGFGINSANYGRKIQGSFKLDNYSVSFIEDLQFLNVPIRILKLNKKWTYKVGINYRYLIKSNASAVLRNTISYNEKTITNYTIKNSINSRNRNLIFLSVEINKKLVDLKNKNWYISAGGELQMGLNSLTRMDKRFFDVDFVSGTNYTDDKVRLCFVNVNIALNYKALHLIK